MALPQSTQQNRSKSQAMSLFTVFSKTLKCPGFSGSTCAKLLRVGTDKDEPQTRPTPSTTIACIKEPQFSTRSIDLILTCKPDNTITDAGTLIFF